MEKLQPGEKYLNVVIMGSLKVPMFKNKNKKTNKDPDYIGNGIVAWITEKKSASSNVKNTFGDL